MKDFGVSVLVLNHNGRPHLDACFASLEAQTYPRDRFEVVLVDNGSTDGSIAFVTRKFPRTRVFGSPSQPRVRRVRTTRRFESCESEFVALAEQRCPRRCAMARRAGIGGRRHDAVAVASKILDWNGDTIDFAGGAMSFIGHAWQPDSGEPATRSLR